MQRSLPVALHLALGSVLLGGVAHAQTIDLFTATLSGNEEVPPVASTAIGVGTATYDRGAQTLSATMDVPGLPGQSAHIHDGGFGVNGGIVVPLGGAGTSWTANGVPLSSTNLAKLLREGLYMNYHTPANPGGELRGQIRVPRHWISDPDGLLEVPPSGSSATARASLTLNQPAGTLTYEVVATGITATAAHIHTGAAGNNGPILFNLSGGPTVFSGTTAPLSDTSLLDLLQGDLYINLHSAAFPGGEIRDQIRPGGLNVDVDEVGSTHGMATALEVGAGPKRAGNLFWILGSTSGTSPGLPVDGGLVLPLNLDAYFLFTLSKPNAIPLSGNFSFLDANGEATAGFSIPAGGPLLNLVGTTIDYAAAVVNPFNGSVQFTTNAHGFLVK